MARDRDLDLLRAALATPVSGAPVAGRVQPAPSIVGDLPAPAPGRDLVWRRVAVLEPEYELCQEDSVVAELRPAMEHGWEARGEAGGGVWRFRRSSGLLWSHVHSAAAPDDRPCASFRGHYFHRGRIETGGELLRWRSRPLRTHQHDLLSAEGARLLRLRPKTKLVRFRRETSVELTRAGWARDDVAELLLLTWYLRLLSERPFFMNPLR